MSHTPDQAAMAPEHGTLDENNTSLFFLLDNEYIEWKFNGNITNKYKKKTELTFILK